MTSFPNTNVCLGISKGHVLREHNGGFVGQPSGQEDPFVYTTGLYTKPHKFEVCKNWDEICIDFHPLGYYHFFNTPSKPKIVNEGFSKVLFSGDDQVRLEGIFNESDLQKRSAEIEDLLISKLKPFDRHNLQLALEHIHAKGGVVSVRDLLIYTKCSERKMYGLFENYFGVTPKWYIRIVRIRQALKLMAFNAKLSLTEVAYQSGYNDQSHFVKEAKLMCDLLPKRLKTDLISIDNQVIISKK
ncbi:MAG: helix-turn-helix domain-containing protein [Bacteroidota bacterium]